MKKFYLKTLGIFLLGSLYLNSQAQVNLPYMLTFTSNDPSWSSGIVTDGTGGTPNINGLDIQIYAGDASFNLITNSGIFYSTNASFFGSNDPSYTGITPYPPSSSSGEYPTLVLKSSNPATNFSLTSIELYDWGWSGVPEHVHIGGYDNGVLVGEVVVEPTYDEGGPFTYTQSGALTPAYFSNIDEVRFSTPETLLGYSPNSFFLSLNNIGLDVAQIVTPVNIVYFKSNPVDLHTTTFKWETAQEINSHHFEIQESADGRQFTTIDSVEAKGYSTTISDYSFTSYHTTPGSYYRLKETDNNGQPTFSNTIAPQAAAGQLQVAVYPNPSSSLVHISSDAHTITAVKAYNASGALVQTLYDNNNLVTLNIAALARGIYYLDISLEDGSVLHRTIVKQ